MDRVRRRLIAAGVLGLPVFGATRTLAQTKPIPKVPPGVDPGGIGVALVGPGIDYTDPAIVHRLARDGEGQLAGFDENTNDSTPFEIDERRLGTKLAQAIVAAVPQVRIVAARLNASGNQPSSSFVVPGTHVVFKVLSPLARVAIFVPARVAGAISNPAKPWDMKIPVDDPDHPITFFRGHADKISDQVPGMLPLFLISAGPTGVPPDELPKLALRPKPGSFLVIAAATSTGQLRDVPMALADRADFGIVTPDDTGGASHEQLAVVRVVRLLMIMLDKQPRTTPQILSGGLAHVARKNSGSGGPRYGFIAG